MLLKASHKPRVISLKTSSGFTDVKIERGQFVLKVLSSDSSITIKSNNKYSIITICKYDEYNNISDEDEQPVNSQRTASEQPVNTDKKVKKVNNVNNRGSKLPLTDKELAFLNLFKEITGRSFKTLDEKTRRQFSELLNEKYNAKDFKKAIAIALVEMTGRDKQNYLTPEFITRPVEFSKYVTMVPIIKQQDKIINTPVINHDNR